MEASSNENSCSHQSSDVPSPSPSPSDMGRSASPVLAVDEWPTILEAISSHQQKSTPPSSSPDLELGNKASKLPPMMLHEYLDSGTDRDCTPRRSVRLQKRVTDLSACAWLHQWYTVNTALKYCAEGQGQLCQITHTQHTPVSQYISMFEMDCSQPVKLAPIWFSVTHTHTT